MIELVDGQNLSLGGASSDTFQLAGGKYGVSAVATFGGGSVKLQRMLPDTSAFVSIGSSSDFTAAGFALVELPPGTYKWVVATATAVIVQMASVPVWTQAPRNVNGAGNPWPRLTPL